MERIGCQEKNGGIREPRRLIYGCLHGGWGRRFFCGAAFVARAEASETGNGEGTVDIHRVVSGRIFRTRISCAAALAAAFLLAAVVPSRARAQAGGETAQTILTAQGKGSKNAPLLERKDISVSVNNRTAETTSLTPLRGADAGVQLVFLIDEGLPGYFGTQIPELRKYVESLPSTTQVGIAYMQNGRAVMAQTLTGNHAAAAKAIRLTQMTPGLSASPYFCLSDLAKHWPSNADTRRVVFLLTNGEDPYYHSRDLQDPYVQSAIVDSQKAGLLVYSLYFRDIGSRGFGSMGVLFGQSYLLMVSTGTGGVAYTQAMSTPVSMTPFLKQFDTALANQYRVTFVAKGKGLQRFKAKSNVPDVKIVAPQAVLVGGTK